MDKKYPTVTIRIDQDLLDATRLLAENLNLSTSQYIREAIENQLDRDTIERQ